MHVENPALFVQSLSKVNDFVDVHSNTELLHNIIHRLWY